MTATDSDTLEWLEGRTYGPVAYRATAERVAEFVAATGDDATRWTDHAPPGFAAALLFAIAPDFLWSDEVARHTKVLLHADQLFEWHAPFVTNQTYEVNGLVDRVRHRSGSDFVNFTVTATSAGSVVMESKSTFIMSAHAGQPVAAQDEPAVVEKADDEPVWKRSHEAIAKSASRTDLIRYAAATGDWNPIHWDHDSAVGAGAPGVIVHGLLMSAWMTQGVCAFVAGSRPIVEMRFRYKQPLLAAQQARLSVAPDDGKFAVALSRASDQLVTATATTAET